jgi:hypothetical protein
MIATAMGLALLGQAPAAETAAERYYSNAIRVLEGKTVEQGVRPRVRSEPPIVKLDPPPVAGEGPPLPKDMKLERDWQVGPKCGPVAVFFLLNAMDIKATLPDVLEKIKVTEDGSSLSQLQAAARDYGLKADVVRFVPEEFSSLATPFIVHWKGPGEESGRNDHFDVVIRTYPDGKATVVDTTDGVVKTIESNRVIGSRASGYALVVRGSGAYASLIKWPLGLIGILDLALVGLLARKFATGRASSRAGVARAAAR